MELLLVFLAGAGVAAFLILVVYDRRVGGADEPMLAEMRGALDRLSTSQGSSAAELKGMLTGFSEAQKHLLQQTTQLSRALARPGVRGQWGESALKRVFEMAGGCPGRRGISVSDLRVHEHRRVRL